jgi:hypothetical protein
MLKNKLSHIAILEEQVEKLQDLANQFSAITGHSLEEVEEGIVRLLTPLALDLALPPAKDDVYKIEWLDGDTVRLTPSQ